MARATATSSAGANSTGACTPDSAAAMAGASRPSSTTARQCISTLAFSGAKSWPLPSPPAISTTGRSMPSRAAWVAATVVPLESLTNKTLPISATRSMRCGKPRKAQSAASTLASILATVEVSASAASAFSALCRPTNARSLAETSSAPPRASQDTACRSTSPQSFSLSGMPAPNVCTMRPGRRIANERASSRLSSCSPPPRKIRAFAAAYSATPA